MRSPRTWACTPWPRRSAGRSWTGEAWRCRRRRTLLRRRRALLRRHQALLRRHQERTSCRPRCLTSPERSRPRQRQEVRHLWEASPGTPRPGDFCLGIPARGLLSGESCPGSPPHGAVLGRRLTVLSPTHEEDLMSRTIIARGAALAAATMLALTACGGTDDAPAEEREAGAAEAADDAPQDGAADEDADTDEEDTGSDEDGADTSTEDSSDDDA